MEEQVLQDREENVTQVEYFQPKFWHRVMANFVDIFLFVIVFLGLFVGTRAVVQATPSYKANLNEMYNLRLESGLYTKVYSSTGSTVDIVKYLEEQEPVYGDQFDIEIDENGNPTEYLFGRNGKCVFAIKTFINFCKEECSEERYNDIVTYYSQGRLDATYDGVHLFVEQEGKVVANESFSSTATNLKYYFSSFYKPFIEKKCLPFLSTNVSRYRQLVKNDYVSLLAIELPIAYTLAAILVYFVPPMFFRRGRMTLGKALYHVGLVDKRLLSPSIPRFLSRFAIFFFGELVLSLASFGIPYIISFSLMAFSKNRQGFPDYMLGLIEVDTSRSNIYLNYVEASLKNELHGKAVDFRPKKPL